MNANEVLEVTSVQNKKSYQKAKESEYKYLKSQHLFTYLNSEYTPACFKYLYINNNVYLKTVINERFLYESEGKTYVKTCNISKWKGWYKKLEYNIQTAEIQETIVETESLISARGRIIKRLKAFDKAFAIPYKKRTVSCFFITLSNVPAARHSIRSFLVQYKKALNKNGIKVLGYVWVSEVSYKGNIEGGHWHYHLVLATERVNCEGRKLPIYLKQAYIGTPAGGGLWKQKSYCEFITFTEKSSACFKYLAKYMSKDSGVVLGVRRYGSSRTFKLP